MFHLLYVLDFFYNEDWYLRTIDICHDHFGMRRACSHVVRYWCLWIKGACTCKSSRC